MAATKSVDYSFLGNSGLKVSNICLGTMKYGTIEKGEGAFPKFFEGPTQKGDEEAFKILDRFVEAGGNFLDTANIYVAGNSERLVGRWLKRKPRDDIVVATKVRFPVTDHDVGNQNGYGLSRRHIIKACEESLSRLQTDYIDLYQAHMWDEGTPVDETLRTFDDLVRCGKIRYYGFSNVCGWQLQKIVEVAKHNNLSQCVSLQQQYNLMTRHPELEELRVCENEGIGVIPWSPLQGGVLTGKYKRNVNPDVTSRAGQMAKLFKEGNVPYSQWDEVKDNDVYWNLIDTMDKIGKKHGKSIAQVALRWLLQKKCVASVIIGASSVKQLEDNLGAGTGWQLDEADMKQLDELSPKPNDYPYSFINLSQAGRDNVFKKY